MPRITLTCESCNGNGFSKSTMRETLHDPTRNVVRGCVSCGGAGSAISLSNACNVSKQTRAFYESAKGYERGSGRVIIEYAHIAGACVHCAGTKCKKCYQTGKNIRFIKQLPSGSRWTIKTVGIVIIALFVATATGNYVAKVPATLIVKISNHAIPIAPPLPATGEIQRFRQDAPNTIYAPFQVTANTVAPFHYLVKLEDWQTGVPLLNIFVRHGEAVNIKVPLGTYRLKYAYGSSWYGPQHLFGKETSVVQAVMPLSFTQESNQVRGKMIDLTPKVTGNMQTVPGNRTIF